jgi:GT2 family glycosyltransferase
VRLSIVILSYNRRDALRRTLTELRAQGLLDSAEVIVVDNHSSDGSGKMVHDEFPSVRWLEQGQNLGVAAFNHGARLSRGDRLLLLDDDSWPDAAALPEALALLDRSPNVAAVALLPTHPTTRAPEWRHDHKAQGAWPIMGCGNLVRTDAWHKVGGYEGTFFLYRNDTDLALKLLAAGYDVWFEPTWIVWHDSPAAAHKSERWLYFATRNWGWLARRHGRGFTKYLGMLAGFAWASRLAGLSLKRQWKVLGGAAASLRHAPPHLPAACKSDGKAFATLVRRQASRS